MSKETIAYKISHTDGNGQPFSNPMDHAFHLNPTSKLSVLYKENSLFLCMDLTRGMLQMNFDTGKTFVDEMVAQLDTVLLKLFNSESKGTHSMDPTGYDEIKVMLNILLLNEYRIECILFNYPLTPETVPDIVSFIGDEIESFLNKEKEAMITDDLLPSLIQTILYLYQQKSIVNSTSILLLTNGLIDVNFSSLHPFILLLIQRDIPLHVFLIAEPWLHHYYSGSQMNSFAVTSALQLEKICHFTRGSVWMAEQFSSLYFIRTIDLSIPYLSSGSNLNPYAYSCLEYRYKKEEFRMQHIVCKQIKVSIEPFIYTCIQYGFELDHVSFLNKNSVTLSFIFPLTHTYHLKLIMYTVKSWMNDSLEQL